jgi:lysozyme
VTFSSGQASKTVSINILDDSIFEANETFAFIIQRNSSDPNTTYLAKSTFTITDNDDLVSTYTITPNPATVSEGAGTLTFAINRFGGMPEEIIYGSSLQTEGYVNGGDYTGILNQPITFASGQASKTVVVAIVDDSTVEAKEKFAFIIQRNASDPNTTYLAKSTFFITDNDANNQCDLRFDGTPTTSPTIVAPGNSILVNYRRLNGEQALAGVSQTKILVVNAAGQVIATSTFSEGTLAAGSVESLSRSITIPPTTAPGSYFVVVNLDHQGILLQTSTANDQSDAIPFAVASSPATETRADLAANGYPLINKTSVFPGESIDVATVFDNVGFGPSPSVEVVLELLDVANNVIESSQIVAPGLAAGSSSGTLNITMVIPTTVLPGPYSIRFVIQGAKINQISYANDYSPSARLFITSTTPPPSEELIEGVDVSRHQGTINWQAVKAAGKHFAYIKASENNQPMHIAYFNANYSNAKQAGLAVGAYHFANPLLAAPFRDNAWSEPERSAKTEAGWFVTIAQPVLGPGHLPPALDIEAHAVSYTQNVSGAWFVDKSFIDPSFGELASDGLLDPLVRMGAEALANWIIDWCSEVERLSGIKPIVYMTKSYSTQLAPYLKDRYSLWIAALSDDSGQPDVTSWGSWFVHQYDWYGTVAGISGNADLNVLRGPISDRVIQSGNLASRGRLEVKGNTILVEVTGGDSQKVTIQGSTSLQGAWQDITTIQLNNGFGEVTTSVDALQQFLRIKPD